jgi:hypothetical protein
VSDFPYRTLDAAGPGNLHRRDEASVGPGSRVFSRTMPQGKRCVTAAS